MEKGMEGVREGGREAERAGGREGGKEGGRFRVKGGRVPGSWETELEDSQDQNESDRGTTPVDFSFYYKLRGKLILPAPMTAGWWSGPPLSILPHVISRTCNQALSLFGRP